MTEQVTALGKTAKELADVTLYLANAERAEQISKALMEVLEGEKVADTQLALAVLIDETVEQGPIPVEYKRATKFAYCIALQELVMRPTRDS